MDHASLSPQALFEQAGPVAKSVIILLGIASVWCWFQIIAGMIALARISFARRAMQRGRIRFILESIFASGNEAAGLRLADETAGERRQRITDSMNMEAKDAFSRLEGGLPNLAVIASVSPFVGLFGTVWGIMAAFTAIAASSDTSLATVAPGIAEALGTTALGLVAAIPASIGYSRLGSAFTAEAQKIAHLIERHAIDLLKTDSGAN